MRLRKNQSEAKDGTTDTRRRRDSKGLGPFSGGQLTIIIVTFAVLLLFPIGAWALTFSNVAITDPGGVNQAKVDSGKNLHTAIADPGGVNVAKVDAKNNLNTAIHDAGTGTAAKVDANGNLLTKDNHLTNNASGALKVAQQGTITAIQGLPTHPWHYSVQGNAAGDTTLFNPPAGITKLAITSLTFTTLPNNAQSFGEVFHFSGPSCSGSVVTTDAQVEVPTTDTVHLSFPTPLVYDLSGGGSVCFYFPQQNVTAVGFYL